MPPPRPSRGPRVLLVSLLGGTNNPSVKTLQASLLSAGHDASILFVPTADLTVLPRVAEFVVQNGFDVVGISLMTPFLAKAEALTRALRQAGGPAPTVIWGGIHPTIAPETCGLADLVCIGEADIQLVRFADAWRPDAPLPDLPGFSRPTSPDPTPCPTPQSLDAIPAPHHLPPHAWIADGHGRVLRLGPEGFARWSLYGGAFLSVMSSRGCPFQCAYCCNHLLQPVVGRGVRTRSVAHVLQEIHRNVARSPVRLAWICMDDDCFLTHDREWLRAFVDGYRALRIPLVFHAIPEYVTEEKLSILAEAPTGRVILGLQSGSARTCREDYQRPLDAGLLLRCAALLDRFGIAASVDVLTGNPWETPEDWAETIRLLGRLPRNTHPSLYSLTFYPHTRIRQRAEREGVDLEGHGSRSQIRLDTRSREVRLLQVATYLHPDLALRLLHRTDWSARFELATLFLLSRTLLEPARQLRVAWLSQQRNVPRFLRFLRVAGVDAGRRFGSRARVGEGFDPGDEARHAEGLPPTPPGPPPPVREPPACGGR